MRNFILLLAVLAFSLSAYEVQAQNTSADEKPGSQFDTRRDNMAHWMDGAQKGFVKYNPKVQVKPVKYNGSELNIKGVKTLNSPDVAVTEQSDVTQSENSIFVDPNDFNYVLNSNNSTSWSGGSVGSLYGANYLQSDDGGLTFGGSEQGAGGNQSGDPTTAIDQNGRQYVGYISSSGGMGVSYSDDGDNWTATTVYAPGSQDKNHMWVDNSLSSPYEGNLYNVWTDFAGSSTILFSRSTDDGESWSSAVDISSAVNAGSHDQGCNVQTGPNGEVYVVWSIYDSWPSDETALGFAKSTDGGATFETATRIVENIKGIRTSETGKNHRVNSFPSMAVDISGGSNDGNIYISWTNIGTPGVNTGQNRSVYIVKSTDGATTWSTAVRVNQGPFDDDREAYFPWITCDAETGVLAAVFYDDRNVSSSDCEAFSAFSLDAGATWTDFVVSDVSFTPSAIPGLAGGYMGDYLAITSLGGKVYPCWTDNRGGLYMTYVSAYALSLNAEFTADAQEICNGSAVTFSDVSTGEPISWDWSFPGGSPDSFIGQNPPAITYNGVGSYSVTLTVSDGAENDTEVKTDFIMVKDVIAEFSGTPTTVVIGNTVTFTDESSCTPTSWTWSFPGGVPDAFVGQTPPAIQYDVEGNYDVTLTVTNASGTDTKTYEDYITVMPPEFNMTNGTITTCMGSFYDSGGPDGSYGNGENFTMTFYPGNTGDMIRFNFTEFEVENNYDYLYIYDGEDVNATLIGTYSGDVEPGMVTANNGSGALTFVFTSDGSVTYSGWVASISCYTGTEPPETDFVASNVYPGIGADVIFTDLSINLPTSWEWSFVPATVDYINGTDQFSQNPEVQFTEVGIYTVSLTTTNGFGNDTETKTDYITADVIYNMADGIVTTCEGTFFDSGGSIGDYMDNENYTMTFYPATTGDMTRFNFTEFEVIDFDYLNIYNGEDATALLIGVYSGTIIPDLVTANNTAGALTFVFTSNGNSTNSGWAAEISCYTITEPPVADFITANTAPVIDTDVSFTDLSSNLPTSWEWSFDPTTVNFINGTDEFSQNPEVQFNELGFYSVSLTATNDYGSGTETKDDYIEVVEPSLCLDSLYITGCSLGDGLTSWDLINVNVPVIECGNGDPYDWYHDFTDMIHALEAGSDYILTVQCGYSNTYLDVWIDYNEDLILDDDEHIVDDYLLAATGTDYEIPITIPADAPDGQFILRYRTNWNATVDESCAIYTYGNMCDFTAEIGEAEFPAPTDLTATIDDTDITLSWIAPDNATPNSYNVFRDNVLISNTTETNYADLDVGNGTFEYCVTAVYTEGESYDICTTVITELPEADFVASNTVPGINSDVIFTDLTTNSPSSWEWSFDPVTVVYVNGTDEFSQNPEVQFTEVGSYTVTLTAANYFGSDTETKTDYIYVDILYNMADGTVTSCTGTFFDSGGADGEYQSDEDLTMTFYPEYVSSAVEIIFTEFNLEPNYDYLNIYDGEDASAPLIGTFTGSESPGSVTATNLEGALTFNFTSDGSVTYSGWAAEITCISVLEAPTNLMADVVENDVTLSWTAPVNGEQTGYNVYRNSEMIATIIETNYQDMDLDNGPYEYCVSAVYDEGESGQVCTSFDIVEIVPPTDLAGSVYNNDVVLTWTAPPGGYATDYNIYRDEEIIGTTTYTSYADIGVPSGVYTYCVTAVYPNGESECSNEYIADVITGINNSLAKSTQIFPNPANDIVNLKSETQIESVKVYNNTGHLVADKQVNNNFFQLNTSQFESGIYFFQIRTNESVTSKRIIIQ